MKRYTDEERPPEHTLGCYDCGLLYTDPAWIEAVVASDVWEVISPSRHRGSGLLCINCMSRRCVEAGLNDVPVMLAAGPFVAKTYEPAGAT